MWCKECNIEVLDDTCPYCGNKTQYDIPIEIYWCPNCKVPIIREVNSIVKDICPRCNSTIYYLCKDLRPIFPQERLLLEIIKKKPFKFKDKSVWGINNRYYINGLDNKTSITVKQMRNLNVNVIRNKLKEYNEENKRTKNIFDKYIDVFIEANQDRLNQLKYEAHTFIKETKEKYCNEDVVVSFSGGKDSTVVSDLVMKALSKPSTVHIFGDTTLEFPLTLDYVNRFRKNNPGTIVRTAKNKDNEFYNVCRDIGPPSRVMRWCCNMFKVGPFTRRINSMFKDNNVLTFYGIRKSESVSRSKYERVDSGSEDRENIKIQKQIVASPILHWHNIDVWLYILSEKLDFNNAYRLGYERVGCWCCPNNSERSHFLNKIYMPDETKKWRDFLIGFAKKIGKPDAEIYVDTGKWKARQGGYGVEAAEDIQIEYSNCTTNENAKIYKLNKDIKDEFYTLFIPFGIVSKELGRKLINEVLVLHPRTKMPIISIEPFTSNEFETSVKIQTMNVKDHDDLQRMISYQIRKYNACRQCLKCEAVCKFNAITINNGKYIIDEKKCRKCKKCVTAKYITGGCLMYKYLFSSSKGD